ncbi:branched-chain amino acid aminotransferase [Colletotrichum scovillei]|uniref:Branched-chain-amino-acid aminotransferase n=1 Tax=Colletotrichum scovillei TaxID=1209932 RepID=A0A9P7REJ6_9PEZI|nr:branched-chain amino acid aminotransferase [Colletotrichum scovillei]KAF4772952.1 branched-chain amino acid aminotransferase [Colletotrichum scovillei]KAG7054571.1 branched-chain amino acid aminotransferase [Colletotrichum scovillei]KAG7074050.1 branched-chain amino acid aminotransferase [Colletotrichum scovillei]KAG7081126.1 branched-chain amino acid aminotransferase [Colletotrichum scovillei]
MSPSAIRTSSAALPKASGLPDNGHTYAELDVTKMLKTLVPEADQLPVPDAHDPVRLGQNCTTAHMVQVPWSMQSGWGTPVMSPYGKIALEPTASVLHYATESFEGMKAYRGHDNKLRLFRPDLNCARLLKSNARVGLPSFDPSALLAIITTFLGTECPRWLPDPGTNIYVRPAMVGSGSALGINQPPEALFFLFAALFPQSLGGGSANAPHPGIKLLASSPEHIRAWPGGFGSAKVGANYGPAMVSHAAAKAQGCTQTLWLFGEERIVTEAGASNFFVVWKKKGGEGIELVTSSLDTEVILDGITRRSVLEVARERLTRESTAETELVPLEVVERPFIMGEIVEAYEEGRLVEAFVSGTAMFITPVSVIKYGDVEIQFPMMVTQEGHKTPRSVYSNTIKSWLEDIIYGRVEHEWGYVVAEQ